MTALIVIGIIALFIVFLCSLGATVTIEYDGEVTLWVRVLFVKIRLLPSRPKRRKRSMSKKQAEKIKERLAKKEAKKRAKKAEKKRKKAEKKAAVESGKAKKEKKSPAEILDIISLVCNLTTKIISRFFKHLKIKVARIKMKIATDDAAATALTYGAVTQSINVLFPLLDSVKTLSLPNAKDIDIRADFTSEESEIDIKISFTLRVWHLLHVAFAALGELIKYFFKSAKRKDETNNHR